MAQTLAAHDRGSPLRNHGSSAPESSLPRDFASSPKEKHGIVEEETMASRVSSAMSRRTSHDIDPLSASSGITSSFPSTPGSINPAPAYVAQAGVAQMLGSNGRPDSDAEDGQDEDRMKDVRFSAPAFALINAFLDQLLYSFLASARSIRLDAVRPAVADVLKSRLAREAVTYAETELEGLLADGDEDEDEDEDSDAGDKALREKERWDLDVVWRRTRLRIMVHTSLGEFEDEDEERYLSGDESSHIDERRFSSSAGLVSWSAALFLTSVLEYVAEQTMQIAIQAAYARIRRQSRGHRRSISSEALKDGCFVEESDVEKVALNPTLGRLWRTWRKVSRSGGRPITPAPSALSRVTTAEESRPVTALSNVADPSRDGSVTDDVQPPPSELREVEEEPDTRDPMHILGSNTALPLGNETRDIDEIIVPGLARDVDDETETEEDTDLPYADEALAILVALPLISDKRDIDEIEVPGLAIDPDAEVEDFATRPPPDQIVRRNSFPLYLSRESLEKLSIEDDASPSASQELEQVIATRPRSMSLPSRDCVPAVAKEVPLKVLAALERSVVVESDETQSAEDKEEATAVMEEVQPVEEKVEAPAVEKEVRPTEETVEAPAVEHDEESTSKDTASQIKDEHQAGEDSSANIEAAVAVGAVAVAAPVVTALAVNSKADEIANVANDDKVAQSEAEAPAPIERSPEVEEPQSIVNVEEISRQITPPSVDSVPPAVIPIEASGEPFSAAAQPDVSPISRQTSHESFSLVDEKASVPAPPVSKPNELVDMSRSAPPATVPGVEPQTATVKLAKTERKRSVEPLQIQPNAAALPDASAKEVMKPRTPRQYLDLTAEPETSTEKSLSPVSEDNDEEVYPVKKPRTPSEPDELSRSAATSINKRPSTESGGVQEHPMVQKMAVRKGSENGSSPASEKTPPLTSASIRGPEDFDLFVQGGETIKYTLTPEHVRDEPGESQVRYAKARELPADELVVPAARPGAPSANNQRELPVAGSEQALPPPNVRTNSKPSLKNIGTNIKSGLTAREPRVMTESTRDFSDFLRSTKPTNQDGPPQPLLTKASASSLHSLRAAHLNGANVPASAPTGTDQSRTFLSDEDVPPVPPVPAQNARRMQARDANVAGDDSADLIDFIRGGPKEDGKPSVSRVIAPKQPNGGSEQLNDLRTRQSVDALANTTFRPIPTTQPAPQDTSLASHPPTNGSGQAYYQNGQSRAQPAATSRGIVPTRKQYRDPYSLDSDGEDEDDFVVSPPPRRPRNDESLLDFLRTQEPPASGPPRLLIDPNSPQARRIIANARAAQNSHAGQARSMANTGEPRVVTQSSAAFIPIAPQAPISHPLKSNKPKMEARSSGSKSRYSTTFSNVIDLADFIRNSGPTDERSSTPTPAVGRLNGNSNAGSKKRGSIFGRGKNQRYLDMP